MKDKFGGFDKKLNTRCYFCNDISQLDGISETHPRDANVKKRDGA